MAEKIIKALVPGGKATAGPPIGPTLAPMGMNVAEVVKQINEKTKSFDGMNVPVSIIIDGATKKFTIEVGTPPASALILKEIGSESGAANPKTEKMGDLTIDQVVKIARAKKDVMHGLTPQKQVKEILGGCVSMGVLVEGKDAREVQKEVDAGKYNDKILGEIKELTKDEISKRNKHYQEAVASTRQRIIAEKEAAKAAATTPVEGAAAAPAPAEKKKEEKPAKKK